MAKKHKVYHTYQPDQLQKCIDMYWDYYCSFEEDYANLESNLRKKKIAITKLMIAVCAEVETMLKTSCQRCDPTFTGDNIKELRKKIKVLIGQDEWPEIDVDIVLKSTNHKYRPWLGYEDEQTSLAWWNKYNDIKHRRTSVEIDGKTIFDGVSIEDLNNAMAALYILTLTYMEYMSGYLIDDSNINCQEFKSSIFELA